MAQVSRKRRCVLVGNYGAGNIGDEALREYFLSAFREIDWSIVSATPRLAHEVPRLPFGLRSFFCPWWRTVYAFFRADAVVCGGGTLFTDIESVSACLLWGMHAFLAWVFRRPLILAFQGVGPFHTYIGEVIARWVYRRALWVSVRDERSFDRLHGWGLSVSPMRTADPALLRFAAFVPTLATTPLTLAVIPRPQAALLFLDRFDACMNREQWTSVRVILMEPTARERALGEMLCARVGSRCPCTVIPTHSVDEFLTALDPCQAVLSMRYHGALAALARGIPYEVVSQAPGDKLSTVASLDRAEALRRVEQAEVALRALLAGMSRAPGAPGNSSVA